MQVRELLHKRSPFDKEQIEGLSLVRESWHEPHPVFEAIISQLKPKLIIEVGTWKGDSAIHMAELCKKHRLVDTEIVCVDTWLGSAEHWENEEWLKSLNLVGGYPSLYYQFLANVMLTENHDCITPFPIASLHAARYLKRKNILADLVYLDASHDYADVRADIVSFWERLRPGGVLLGDDFHAHWHGVVRAVDEFSEEIHQAINCAQNKWWFQKP